MRTQAYVEILKRFWAHLSGQRHRQLLFLMCLMLAGLTDRNYFPSVLSGVSESQLVARSGNYDDYEWVLLPGQSPNEWDLCVGNCSVAFVPVMGPWGLMALGGLSGLLGLWGIRRRQQSRAATAKT